MRLQLVTGKTSPFSRVLSKKRQAFFRASAAKAVGGPPFHEGRFAPVCAAFFALCLTAAAPARADEASGTWTGSLEGRGNYYWETSTRVIVPEIELKVEAPNGVRAGIGELVDVISSASIAQTGSDVDAVFTELRHGIHAEVGKEFDLGNVQLDPSMHATYSTEDDYTSWIYGVGADFSFAERTNKVSLGVALVNDTIEANNDPAFEGELNGITTTLAYERVLTPILVLTVGYQLGYLQGFLGNPYRRVVFEEGAPIREAPPGSRTRHNASAKLALYIPPTHTALHFLYRGYIDSWNIGAITPELRVLQEVGEDLIVRSHYRFYAQTAASFVRVDGTPYPGSSSMPLGPSSNDPKLSELTTHTFGVGLEYRLGFLEDSFLGFARNASIDISVDRYLSSSTFGDGVMATAGGRLPF
jgi:hypothetical protein